MKYRGVAISGKAGAGKSAFASHLQRELERRGVASMICGFADALKYDVEQKYGLTKDMPGGRDMLLKHGTAMRDRYPLHWVHRLAHTLEGQDYYPLPLIADCRFLNEYEWAKREGFLTVRVDAGPLDRQIVLHFRKSENLDFVWSDHPSEVELDDAEFDVRFWNPHGDGQTALRHFAVRVADLLEEVAVEPAA